MADSQRTRAVWLPPEVDRDSASNYGTRFALHRDPPILDFKALFNQHQRSMGEAIAGFARPGLMTFAVSNRRGLCGQLWLDAASGLRAGTVGRHGKTDLFLPWDEGLSLRHLLLLVRQHGSSLSIRVVDLETPTAFHAESGEILRLAEAEGPLVLQAAEYALFLVPTGAPPPWDPQAPNPWSTLAPRTLTRQERALASEAPAPAPGEQTAEGVLVAVHENREEALPMSHGALERGVLLGRYDRCGVRASWDATGLSRVHALLLTIDGQVHLADAGSTNGCWRGEERIKCAPLLPGELYRLGNELTFRWEPVQ